MLLLPPPLLLLMLSHRRLRVRVAEKGTDRVKVKAKVKGRTRRSLRSWNRVVCCRCR